MMKTLIHNILRRRHFWREADFDELSEVYVAMIFRSLALSLIGIFVPVYLLQLDYGIVGIIHFYLYFFSARMCFDFIGAHLVARFGPKHAMLISYGFQIMAALLFLTLKDYSWPLYIPAMIWGASNSIFFIAFHVNFSKIKHVDNGGKEIGYVNVMERIGGMIGPFVGGMLAMVFGAQYLFLIAIILLLIGLVPLFRTAEPVKTRQKLHYRAFKLNDMKRDVASYGAFSIENNLLIVLWPAFLTLFVFADNVYATIGGLASIGSLVSVAAAYAVGKLVDEKRGGQLLRFATVANAFVYVFRPFVNGVAAVLGVNVVNEALTVGYRIPYTKGWYDAADQHPGFRIVYISVIEAFGSFCKCLVWAELLLLSSVLNTYQLIVLGFIIAGVSSLLINLQSFKALQ